LQNLALFKNLCNVLSLLAAKIGSGKLFAKCPNVAFDNNPTTPFPAQEYRDSAAQKLV
jgi:hypothetical protein